MNDILDIVKKLSGIEDDSKDDILLLQIDIAVQSVLNYCNIKELPEELRYVVAQMVLDMYAEATGGDTSALSKVSESGRSVSFDSSLLQISARNKVKDRQQQLNRFKRLYR